MAKTKRLTAVKPGKTTRKRKTPAPASKPEVSPEEATRIATALLTKAGDSNTCYLFAVLQEYTIDDEKAAMAEMKADGWTLEAIKADLIEHLAGLFESNGWFAPKTLKEYLADENRLAFFDDANWN